MSGTCRRTAVTDLNAIVGDNRGHSADASTLKKNEPAMKDFLIDMQNTALSQDIAFQSYRRYSADKRRPGKSVRATKHFSTPPRLNFERAPGGTGS